MAEYDAQPGRESQAGTDLSAAQREADEIDLYAGLTGVAGLVAGARGLIDLLGDVAEFAAQAIPGVDGAGVALLQTHEGAPRIRSWAATAQIVDDIDKVQYEELARDPASRAWSRDGWSSADHSAAYNVAPFRWPGGANGGAFRAVTSAGGRRRGDRRDQLLCPQPRCVR